MTNSAVAGQNPVEVPLYTPSDVARYLRAPWWVVATLRLGRPPHHEYFFEAWHRPWRHLADEERFPHFPEMKGRLSFREFADYYVRKFVAAGLIDAAEGDVDERMYEAAVGLLGNRSAGFFGNGPPGQAVDAALASAYPRLDESERAWLGKKVALCLSRFDVEDGVPVRLYPFSRNPPEGCPRIVAMDPAIRFGRPTVAGRGVPTDILMERHQAGDSIAEMAEDYDVPAAEIEEALRFEAMPPSPWFPYFGW